ncbi:anthranilate synthase family protein [Streptomyces sp. NPDC088387]|uniref:anthranilate synthase family protein n=1 Tax=Streptomyces sp. NPDC088387 TaxID=3365859 RepID=UPI003826F4B9
MTADPLARVLGEDPPPFALLHRPGTTGRGELDVLTGDFSAVERLADLPVPEPPADGTHGGGRHDLLVLVPYRQITERGFAGPAEDTPLLAMEVAEQRRYALSEVLDRLPDVPLGLTGGHFDVDDERYAELVRSVVAEEIGTGEGANFVIKRSYRAGVTDYGPHSPLTLFRRLLEGESGAYWTFLVHTGERTLVGASPERHISVHAGRAVMNPISGTYRYPPAGPTLTGLMGFLKDPKETDELYMVVDEELKMMSRVCPEGGQVVGPFLKEMARLAHTEYFIEGRTGRDPRDILRETMFAPTVTGSPLENACRVIARHEPTGRGYYSGVIALLGRDADGGHALDSSIVIRTADIDTRGNLEITVGATLVRHSDPSSEAAETRAKAAGLIAAFDTGRPHTPGEERTPPARLGDLPAVRAALVERNAAMADFWLAATHERVRHDPALAGRRALVVDAEDTFTSMIAQQLSSLGLRVTVRRFDETCDPTAYDITVMGPGPGDPRNSGHPKIARLERLTGQLLDTRLPFLAVCLSHQVLARRIGLPLTRRETPNQGVQHHVDLFGRHETVGFYNTFAAVCADDKFEAPGVGVVEVARSPETDEVHALLGPHFASMQFHAESVLTRGGPRILRTLLTEVLRRGEG